jgi:hypothetical protein
VGKSPRQTYSCEIYATVIDPRKGRNGCGTRTGDVGGGRGLEAGAAGVAPDAAAHNELGAARAEIGGRGGGGRRERAQHGREQEGGAEGRHCRRRVEE